MAREINTILIHLLMMLCLMGTLIQPTVGTESDVYCLKSIKDSLQDPHNHLSSWVFTSRERAESFICSFRGVQCWSSVEKIMHLSLRDMGLKGQFPRGLQNCTSLTGLNLSGNNLEGPIPFDIPTIIPNVVTLDLSFNKLSGKIPSSIAGCYYLNVLKLDHNLLQGQIPPQISHLKRLANFDVSYNLLLGPIPENLPFERNSYANNGLCGKPLDVCLEARQRFKFDYKSFKSGFLIGYVVFFVSVAVVFVSYCVPWLGDVKSNNKKITVGQLMMLNFKTRKSRRVPDDQVAVLVVPASKLQQERRKQISRLEKIVERMSLTDLCNATGNFSHHNLIGAGQTGTMYKATVGGNGWLLAVKRLHDSQHSKEQLVSEVKTLGRLRHENLLPLIGFCIKSNERLLVYKYMSNGNLFDWLHPAEADNSILGSPLRVRIAIGIARGLAWLHHGCSPPVAHLNISTKCVLLDRSFVPKLSNFGRAMPINPESIHDLNNTYSIQEQGLFKKDVFSFGVVLLELVTGKKFSHFNNLSLYGRVDDLVSDNSVVGEGFDDDDMVKLLRVASSCVQPLPESRPSMLHVLKTIATSGELYAFGDVREEVALSKLRD